MIEIKNKYPQLYKKIEIINPNRFVLEVLKMMYLDKVYEIFQLGRPV
jgi:hypothetical protein